MASERSTHPDTTAYELNDGTTLPAIGFGTYPLTGEDGIAAMVAALESGYRLLDSAVNYGNETEVGEALRRSGLPREEVALTTKIPGRFHAKELALQSLRDSATRFRVEQLDVALIHWPNPSQDLYPQAWQALVEAQALEGLAGAAPRLVVRVVAPRELAGDENLVAGEPRAPDRLADLALVLVVHGGVEEPVADLERARDRRDPVVASQRVGTEADRRQRGAVVQR